MTVKRHLLVMAACIALAGIATYPISQIWRGALPDVNDALFNVWRLAWFAHALAEAPDRLFDGNIFYPATGTLAYSDAMPFLGVLGAPLQWAGMHPVAVHNLLLVAAFAGAAYGAFLLAWRLTHSASAGMLAAIVFALAPYRFAHIGHLELLWTIFIPLAVLCAIRVMERPSVGGGVLLGVVAALQAFTGVYYFVFLSVYLAVFIVALLAAARERGDLQRRALAFSVAGFVVAATVTPYALLYRDATRDVRSREREEVARYSATASDYFTASPRNRLYGGAPREADEERSLFPGAVALVFAVAGIGAALSGRGARCTAALVVAGAVAFELSRGVNGVIYPALVSVAPALAFLRAPARFGVFVLLSTAIIAAGGVAAIRRPALRRWTAAAAALVCLVEYWSAPIGMREVTMQPLNVHRWLVEQPPGVVLALPLPDPAALWGDETTHQFLSIYHWRPLVNGYSGHAPHSYVRALEALREFPFGRTGAMLDRLDVRYVIVDGRLMGADFDRMVADSRASALFCEPIYFRERGGPVAVLRRRDADCAEAQGLTQIRPIAPITKDNADCADSTDSKGSTQISQISQIR